MVSASAHRPFSRPWASACAVVFLLASTTGSQADPIIPGREHCVVNVPADDVLNLRRHPNPRAEIDARKRYGQCGILLHRPCRASWCSVEDGHSIGWAHRRYLAAVSSPDYCLSAGVLRAYPSAGSRILAQFPRSCGVALLPYAVSGWQKIRIGGWQGWVERRRLTP